MSIAGTLLKNRRAGEGGLVRNLPALADGALSPATASDGVRLLKSTMGRGYVGPSPIKGHGPHRYVFELFALAAPAASDDAAAVNARPRALLGAGPGPVLARGRLTGTYER